MKKLVVSLLIIVALFLVGCSSNIDGTYVFSKMEGTAEGLSFSVMADELDDADETVAFIAATFAEMKIIIEGDDLTLEMDGETNTAKFTRQGNTIIIEGEEEDIDEISDMEITVKNDKLIMKINSDGTEVSVTFVLVR